MANYLTGLEPALARAGIEEGTGTADIILSERRHMQITQISFFKAQEKSLNSYLQNLNNLSLPSFSCCDMADELAAARIEMSKIWILGALDIKEVPASFYPLDLSSSRSVLRVQGPRANDLLARLCAVDFRDDLRNFHGTSIHHCAVHIHKLERGFDIYMPRSFGESLTDFIIDIARQYHVQMA